MNELYDPEAYNNREWFLSLQWQHRWIEFMTGWWTGHFGKPTSVCDFGAGDGWWPWSFHKIGVETAYAIELHELAREYIPKAVYFVQRDLREPFTDGELFDLTICLEVAEHLPESAVEPLCQTLTAHTGKHLLFSAASPDQPGTGHFNLQPQAYWREKIERWGKIKFSPLKTGETRTAFKKIVNDTLSYLPKNVMVFARI